MFDDGKSPLEIPNPNMKSHVGHIKSMQSIPHYMVYIYKYMVSIHILYLNPPSFPQFHVEELGLLEFSQVIGIVFLCQRSANPREIWRQKKIWQIMINPLYKSLVNHDKYLLDFHFSVG